MAKPELLVFFGHHKCASAWINQICEKICNYLGINHRAVFTPQEFNEDLEKYIRKNQVQFLTYGNANYEYVQQLNSLRGFHVVRDPRDVLVSAYFSHLYSHPLENWPELKNHREKLQLLPKDEGLLCDMAFNQPFLDDMFSWDYQAPNIIQIRMENLVSKPFEYFSNIYKYMGLMVASPVDYLELLGYKIVRRTHRVANRSINLTNRKLSSTNLRSFLDEMDFKKASGGREIGQENKHNHYRRGLPGDWKNHFKMIHIQYFVDHYNPVLFKLGYENDPGWADQYL